MLKKDDKTKQMVYYQVGFLFLYLHVLLIHDTFVGRYWDLHFTCGSHSIYVQNI